MFVTYISAWKNFKLSGNDSSRAPCVRGWISNMPSSLSSSVPRSRNSLANRISMWCPPKRTLHIWSDASMHAGGTHTDSGFHFQFTWSELEAGKHINRLELRAAWYALLQLTSPGDVVQLHLDITTAITYIRKMGRTHSLSLCKESHLLWCQAIRRNLTLHLPLWIST